MFFRQDANYDDLMEIDQEVGYQSEEEVSSFSEETDSVKTAPIQNEQKSAIQRGKINFITPRLVAALDNCKVSDRYATHLLVAVAEALGHSLKDLVINRETIRKCRIKHRKEIAKQVKDDFLNAVSIFLIPIENFD